MNGNFVQSITSAIQNKQSLETSIDPKLINQNWTAVVNMIDSHPEKYIHREPNKNRIDLNELHLRESVLPVVTEMISLLQSICPDKKITNIAYMGFGKHQSFPRHKDTMDVLLLQVKGRINVDVEEKIKTTSFIDEKTGEKEYRSEIWTFWYTNGKMKFEGLYKDWALISKKCWNSKGESISCDSLVISGSEKLRMFKDQ